MKLKKKMFIIIILIIMFIFYISFPLMVMQDSTEYYGFLKIFRGEVNISNWISMRGPSFPAILYLITIIFGNSQFGLLVGTFVFYLITVTLGYFIIQKINIENIIFKYIINFIYIIAVVFNPILIGYMHGLLTEFVAIPSILIASLLSFKWINVNKKIIKIILSILLIIGTIFMWFVKQPYVFLFLAPILVSSVISIFENKKVKNIIYRISISLLCIISVVFTNSIWNNFLTKNGVNTNTGRVTGNFIKTAIINGNSSFSIDTYKDHYKLDYIFNSNLIIDEDKLEIEKIINNQSEYKSYSLINIFNNFKSREETNIQQKIVMYSKEKEFTMLDASNFYFKLITEHPLKTIKSYTMNYLAISDAITAMRHKDANEYYPSLTEKLYPENMTIGYSIFREEDNLMWLDSSHPLYNNVINLKTDNNSPTIIKNFFNKLYDQYNLIYIISILSLPIFCVLIIIKRLRVKVDKYKKVLNIGIILLFSSFIHVLFNTFTGAIIDRYTFVILPSVIIGVLIYLFQPIYLKEQKKMIKFFNSGNKVLFVIPAYNESENITKVIEEVRKDVSYADILVINDNSKDNTKEVVENAGIKCISLPFNVKYAMAVQTGIKYAYQNDYDYVIQFDADGQHIAKEAEKLLNKMKESNSDIIIGSRFLEKTDYPHSFFRRVGTKIFTFLISLFCKKKITDPTSGFQCLNKRVIKRYDSNYPEFPDANLIMEMIYEGYDIQEISTNMRVRENGESMHGGIIKPIKYMILILYTIIIILIRNIFRKRV
ncbi:MAG: glycosyltransferase family 2 protein [Clostridia bacterium]|nr:glycosyltransferase family 2 protein [Clostridia bacterium]MDD4386829.1 glycosyltransferase family 2 protein [Clostridia bacterium]